MARRDDVLGQSGMGQVESAMRVSEYSGSLRRADLKSRMAHPFNQSRRGWAGRNAQKIFLDHFQFVAKAEPIARPDPGIESAPRMRFSKTCLPSRLPTLAACFGSGVFNSKLQ